MSVRDYLDAKAGEEAKRRCKNLSQKRTYLVKELGLKLQFDLWSASKLQAANPNPEKHRFDTV